MNPHTHVIVFAKAPIAGQVKTRLIPTLGALGAARLAQHLLNDTMSRVAAAGATSVELCCAPDTSHLAFTRAASCYGAHLTTQTGHDLGARMASALQRALATHARVLLIGTDCPQLDGAALRAADDAFDQEHDAVFAPTSDGGYALIGLQRYDDTLFSGITWSTESVMSATRIQLQRLQWRWTELPVRADVDRPEDLTHLPPEWLTA